MDKNKIDEFLEREILNITQNNQKAVEKLLAWQNQNRPLVIDLHIRHLDILLETAKNFLLVSSTVFIAAIALNTSILINIDVNLIRIISGLVMVGAVLFIIGILWIRGNETYKIIENINETEKIYRELLNLNLDSILTEKKLAEIKESVKVKLKK